MFIVACHWQKHEDSVHAIVCSMIQGIPPLVFLRGVQIGFPVTSEVEETQTRIGLWRLHVS